MASRVPAALAREIGRRLREEKAKVEERRAVARAHGVRERTVRNWMRASKDPPRKLGRPGYTKKERYHALRAVGRQHRLQGRKAGWRPIEKVLCGSVPTALVQETLRVWKKRNRKRQRKRIEANRVSVMVNARDVIWTQDGMHLGRVNENDAVEGQVLKDRGTTQTVAGAAGPEATSQELIELFEMIESEGSMLPLVWQTDNKSTYRSRSIQDYLERKQIIPLPSRVHTPTDNGAAEIQVRELKDESDLGKGVKLSSALDAALLLGKSAMLIDEHRLRGSRGYVSANTLAETMPTWYGRVNREQFYNETRSAVENAVQNKTGKRARQAEREAVFVVLTKYGLITRTRGGRPFDAPLEEIIS